MKIKELSCRWVRNFGLAGPLAASTAQTEITITNRTGQPCSATVRFHQGTAEAPRVRFNGRHLDNNTLETSIPAGHSQKLTLTSDAGQDLAVGAVYIKQSPRCAADALQVEARYLITRKDGEIMEAFSILPQKPTDWLSNRDCRIMAVDFGPNNQVGLAMVTAKPDMPAPAEPEHSDQVKPLTQAGPRAGRQMLGPCRPPRAGQTPTSWGWARLRKEL